MTDLNDDQALSLAQTAGAVMLAYFRKPFEFKGAADRVFMALCERTFGELREEAQISRAELMEATGLGASTVSIALTKLLEMGVISRRKPPGRSAHVYRIEREKILQIVE